MFYIKTELAEGVTLRTEITDENVFTQCPVCGAEKLVDLSDLIDGGGRVDLCGTNVYCAECYKKRSERGE